MSNSWLRWLVTWVVLHLSCAMRPGVVRPGPSMRVDSFHPRRRKAHQQDFKTFTGRWVPIIKWTVSPADASGMAKFTFDPSEQAIQQ